MKLERDIRAMSEGEVRQELMRVRQLIRTHRDRRGNARCHHADEELYGRILPEQKPAGRMTGKKEDLLRECARYIDRQKCDSKTCSFAHGEK